MSAISKKASADPAERELAERLRDSEAKVLAASARQGIACTILRPTLIYGAGTDRSLAPIARFAQRWHILPIPIDAFGLRQPVHAADLARACVDALDCPATFGRTYELGGSERLSFTALLWRLRAITPGFVLPLPIPLFLLILMVKLRRAAFVNPAALARLRQPLLADNRDAERDFSYAPCPFRAEDVLGSSDD